MSKTILDFPSYDEIFNTEFRNTLPCFVAPAGISARRRNPKGASYSHVIAHTYIYIGKYLRLKYADVIVHQKT